MAEATEQVKEVLQFLTRNGFYKAALALSEDVVARRGFIDYGDLGLDLVLHPVRIEVGRPRPSGGDSGVRSGNSQEAEDSLSEEEFLSIECSSPIEDDIKRNNLFGRWPSVGADVSLGSASEFSTARDCTLSSMFSDVNWYDEKFGGCLHDSCLMPTNSIASRSKDKFSMAMQGDHIYGEKKNSKFISEASICCLGRSESEVEAGCEDCPKFFGPSVAPCEMKVSSKSPEWVALSESSQYKKPVTFEKEGEVAKTTNREVVSSGHFDYKLNSREHLTNGHLKPLEGELHILPSFSTHKGEIGDPEDGFWKNVLSDFSFQNLKSSREEQNMEPHALEKDLDMLNFSSVDSSAHAKNDHEFNDKESFHYPDLCMKEKLVNGVNTNDLQSGLDLHIVTGNASQSDVKESFELKDKEEIISHAHSREFFVDEKDDSADNNVNPMYKPNDTEYEIFELRIVHGKNRTGFEENKDLPIVLNSVVAGRYCVTEYLGSATFSKVVQAHDLETGMDVCLKIIKNNKDFFDQSLDEIKLLRLVNKHDPADEHHILRLYDYFYHQEHLFIVCEVLKENLYEYQKYIQESGEELYYTMPRIQSIAKQCLKALEYLHNLGIIHCDLKPENIMIKSYSRCEIKIIDLGSSCFQTDNLTFYVQSRSYRAPEVILGLPYNQKIDIWSLGCILAELFSGEVLFPNVSVATLLARMTGILGPFDMEILNMGLETHKYFTDNLDIYDKNEETDQVEYIIPEKLSLVYHLNFPDGPDLLFTDFLTCLLQTNPQRRPTAAEALEHPWLIQTYS